MAERLVRAWDCLEAGEGGSRSSSSSSSAEDGVEEGEEADEGGEVEKAVVCRVLCCFERRDCWCCACGFEEEGEVEEVEEADDIRGVVALSVMCTASDGCCEGRLAMLGWLADVCVCVCVLDCSPGQ